MNMKKISALVLALAMAMSLCVSASATALDPNRNTVSQVPDSSTTIDVTGKYVNKAAKTYSVDIEWGSMAFTYTINDTAVWDPVNHVYTAGTGDSVGTWSCNDPLGDRITVTNNSNAPVKLNFITQGAEPAPGTSYGNVSITVDGIAADTILKSADGNVVDTVVNGTVVLSGALNNTVTTPTKLFTLTVELTAAD